MTVNLTRRQVVRLAVVGGVTLASTVVASGPLALTILAEPATARAVSTVLVGVRPGDIPVGGASEGVPLVVQSVDLVTGVPQSLQVPQWQPDGTTPLFHMNESISGCAVLVDGSLVVAITPATGSRRETEPTRLVRLSQQSVDTVPITGLRRNEQLSSLLITQAGTLQGLIEKRNGAPPQVLATIDPDTGEITDRDRVHLAGFRRFTTLVECLNGQLYSTAVARNGETVLVQLETGTSVPLTENGVAWDNGMASLVCLSADRLVALTAPRYGSLNGVYSVDPRSGQMARLRDFDTVRVTGLPSHLNLSPTT